MAKKEVPALLLEVRKRLNGIAERKVVSEKASCVYPNHCTFAQCVSEKTGQTSSIPPSYQEELNELRARIDKLENKGAIIVNIPPMTHYLTGSTYIIGEKEESIMSEDGEETPVYKTWSFRTDIIFPTDGTLQGIWVKSNTDLSAVFDVFYVSPVVDDGLIEEDEMDSLDVPLPMLRVNPKEGEEEEEQPDPDTPILTDMFEGDMPQYFFLMKEVKEGSYISIRYKNTISAHIDDIETGEVTPIEYPQLLELGKSFLAVFDGKAEQKVIYL